MTTKTAKEVEKMLLAQGVAKLHAEQNFVYKLNALKSVLAKPNAFFSKEDIENMKAYAVKLEACIAKGRYY